MRQCCAKFSETAIVNCWLSDSVILAATAANRLWLAL